MQGEDQEQEVERKLKELTLHMVRAIVYHADQVRVDSVETATVIEMRLSVAQDDIGRVIGKKGRTINAMRTLLRSSAANQGKRVQLEIVED